MATTFYPVSTAISRIDFDPERMEITVTFKQGGSSTVAGTKAMFDEFCSAPSAGKYWNDVLKQKVR